MESALVQMTLFVSRITCHGGCYQTRFSQQGGKHRSEHLSWRMTYNAPLPPRPATQTRACAQTHTQKMDYSLLGG